MRKKKHWLITMAALLCSITVSAVTLINRKSTYTYA